MALKTAVMLPQLPKRSVTVSYGLGEGQLFPDARVLGGECRLRRQPSTG